MLFKLLTLIAAAAAGFAMGYLLADRDVGFGQPAILALMMVAMIAAGFLRRTEWVIAAGVAIGFGGVEGMRLRLNPRLEDWATISLPLGSISAIACVLSAIPAAWVVRRAARQSANGRE